MWDMTARGVSFRAYSSGGSRGTVASMDTTQLFQEMTGTMFAGETRSKMEHFEPYGFTSAIKSGDANGVAEALMSHVTGARAHAIAGVIGDRRFRLLMLKEGEVSQFDDQTQQRHISRKGILDSTINKLFHQQRIMKPSDKVSQNQSGDSGGGGGGGGSTGGDGLSGGGTSSQQQGQMAWADKTPYSYHHHDKDVQQSEHPMNIKHHIIMGDAMPPNMGSSQIIHSRHITQQNGIQDSAQQGQHTFTLFNGAFRQSSTIVKDTAPNIPHVGNTGVTGNLTVSQITTSQTYDTSSDRRLKENIDPAKYGREHLLKLNVVEFNFIRDPSRRYHGLIAQEVQEICPDFVSMSENDSEGEPSGMLTIDQGSLLALAIKTIQEQQKQIDELSK